MTFRREANLRNVIAVEFTGHKGNNESIPKSKKAVISNEGSSEVEEMNSTENIDVMESSDPSKEKSKIHRLEPRQTLRTLI